MRMLLRCTTMQMLKRTEKILFINCWKAAEILVGLKSMTSVTTFSLAQIATLDKDLRGIRNIINW